MSTNHEHHNTFTLGLILNSGFTIFEFIVGIMTGSLALIADATHNLSDSVTLGIAAIAERISKRPADTGRTYGYGRAKIIASLLNAGILVAVAAFIAFEAVERLSEPTEVPGLAVALVATVGIAINGGIAYLLSKRKHDLNARSAYTNMLYDTLSSVGALLAGIAIIFFDLNWLDSVVGIGIAAMLLLATFGIVREAIHILLEGVPSDVDLKEVEMMLAQIPDVESVDDVHAWTIDNDYYAFSCHLVIDEKKLPQSREIIEKAKTILADNFNFKHYTIEIELEDCLKHEGRV